MNVLEKILEELEERKRFIERVKEENDVESLAFDYRIDELKNVETIIRSHIGGAEVIGSR